MASCYIETDNFLKPLRTIQLNWNWKQNRMSYHHSPRWYQSPKSAGALDQIQSSMSPKVNAYPLDVGNGQNQNKLKLVSGGTGMTSFMTPQLEENNKQLLGSQRVGDVLDHMTLECAQIRVSV